MQFSSTRYHIFVQGRQIMWIWNFYFEKVSKYNDLRDNTFPITVQLIYNDPDQCGTEVKLDEYLVSVKRYAIYGELDLKDPKWDLEGGRIAGDFKTPKKPARRTPDGSPLTASGLTTYHLANVHVFMLKMPFTVQIVPTFTQWSYLLLSQPSSIWTKPCQKGQQQMGNYLRPSCLLRMMTWSCVPGKCRAGVVTKHIFLPSYVSSCGETLPSVHCIRSYSSVFLSLNPVSILGYIRD